MPKMTKGDFNGTVLGSDCNFDTYQDTEMITIFIFIHHISTVLQTRARVKKYHRKLWHFQSTVSRKKQIYIYIKYTKNIYKNKK